MDSSSDKLTPLQHAVLRAFFAHERGFFLTGGAALAGFYLRHRETSDLDFFTTDGGAFERGRYALQAAATSLGAILTTVQEAPGFMRQILTRADDAVVVASDSVAARV